MLDDAPVLGICGWSGSGKTTLIERVVSHLCERGLSVAIVKHDVHGINVDRPGKDSDRFFNAGADVLLQGPRQEFLRTHGTGDPKLIPTLQALVRRYDLILVEGHKGTPLPKVWVLSADETAPPRPDRGQKPTLRAAETPGQIRHGHMAGADRRLPPPRY